MWKLLWRTGMTPNTVIPLPYSHSFAIVSNCYIPYNIRVHVSRIFKLMRSWILVLTDPHTAHLCIITIHLYDVCNLYAVYYRPMSNQYKMWGDAFPILRFPISSLRFRLLFPSLPSFHLLCLLLINPVVESLESAMNNRSQGHSQTAVV